MLLISTLDSSLVIFHFQQWKIISRLSFPGYSEVCRSDASDIMRNEKNFKRNKLVA